MGTQGRRCSTPHQGSPAQASFPPVDLYHITCQHPEGTTLTCLLDSKGLHPFELYTLLSGTEGNHASIKGVRVNPHQLQGRANQETN